MIVADTNLIAHLCLKSKEAESAEKVFIKDSFWIAPPIWRYEMKNLLVTRQRFTDCDLKESVSIYKMAEVIVHEDELKGDPFAVFEVAKETGLSGYDAEFLSLARRLQVKLVTSDQKILKADPVWAISPERFLSTNPDDRLGAGERE